MKLLSDFSKIKTNMRNLDSILKYIVILFIAAAVVLCFIASRLEKKLKTVQNDKLLVTTAAGNFISAEEGKLGGRTKPSAKKTENLKDAESFNLAFHRILKNTEILAVSNQNMISTVNDLVKTFRFPVPALSLEQPENVQKSCSDILLYTDKMIDRDRRSAEALNHIAQMLSIHFGAETKLDLGQMSGKDFNYNEPFFAGLGNAVKRLVDKNSELSKEMQAKDSRITDMENKMAEGSNSVVPLQKKINEQEKELKDIKAKYNEVKSRLDQKLKEDKEKEEKIKETLADLEKRTDFPELYAKLKGEVVDYNSTWGFVIINIGKNTKMKTLINGKEREVNIPIPINKVLYMGDSGNFVGKAKIVKAYDHYSVANIIYPTAQDITIGDIVYFPEASGDSRNDESSGPSINDTGSVTP